MASALFLSVLIAGPAWGQEFGDQLVISTNADSASSVYAADLNGDGRKDVLSASYGNDEIAWYENLGNGDFGAPQVLPTSDRDPSSVVAADLTGDGDKDVLYASSESVSWLENTGGGTFSDPKVININFGDEVFTADLDGDEDQDVLVSSLAADKIYWHENTGGGTFSDERVITSSAERASSVYAADLDGDQDRDVLSTALDSNNVAWYENLGDGSFSEMKVITADASGARSGRAADLDGDGDKDILHTWGFGESNTVWHENTGGGTFSAQKTITTAPAVETVHTANVTGDGEMDVITGSGHKFSDPSNEKVSWYENTGGGTFSSETVITSVPERVEAVYAADMDGDHDVDVLSASFDDDTIAWYQNQGTDGIAPSAPTGLAATAGQGQVDLNWDANTETDLAGYNVYRSTSSFQERVNATKVNSSLVGGTTYTDTEASSGTEYFYRVTAVDESGNESATSNEASATPQADTAPSAPTGLQATSGDEQVDLNWDANTENDLLGYNVYRSTSSFQELANATQVNGAVVDSASYTDGSVSNGTEYYYRVTAVDSSENESFPSNEASAIPEDRIAPAAPTGLQATAGDGQVDLDWDDNTESDLAGYLVYRSTSSFQEVTNATLVNGFLLKSSSYSDTSATNGVEYFYRVTAVDSSNNQSPGSNEASATPGNQTAPAAPTELQAASGDGQVDLSWNANTESDLLGYNVYRSTSSFQELANATRIGSLVETSAYTDSSVSNGTEYFYRVTAVDSSENESSPSNEASAVPADRTPPSAPTALQALAGNGQVDLDWNDNSESDLLGYYVYRSTSSFQEVANATRIGPLVETSAYTDTSVTNGTQYFYRVTAVDSSENESPPSDEGTATPTEALAAQTEEATDVTSTSAVLNGRVNPGGRETTVVFEYAPTGQSGEAQTVTAQESPLTGTEDQSVSAAISGLEPGTEYTFEVLAENSSGSAAGGTQTFTTNTSAPTVETGDVTNVTVAGAQFNGTVNPNGSEATVLFEYHPTQSGGVQTVQAAESPLTGTQSQAVSASVSDLQPQTEYTVQAVASNAVGVERGEPTTFTTQALTLTLERSAQTPEQGSPFTVTATVSQGFVPTDVARLYYRRVGAPSFQSTALDSVNETTYEGTVPGAAVTERGVEYYAQLSNGSVTVTVPNTDPASQPLYAPVRIPGLEAGVGLEADQYRMISVPLRLDSTDAFTQLRDDFGPMDRSVWRLLRWNSNAGEYDEVTTQNGSGDLLPGRAYWLITQSGETRDGQSTFDVGGGRSVSPDPIPVDLPPGWSQVANPRPYPVAWSAVSGRESVMAPVAYDPSAPDSADFNVDLLRPWAGYWVFNPGQSTVQIEVPAPEAETGQAGTVAAKHRSSGTGTLFEEQPAYAVALTARLERAGKPDLRDLHTVMGVADEGTSGVGVEDVAEPPPIGDYLRLSIVEEETRLAGSLRPRGKDGYEWDLEVSASAMKGGRGLVRGDLEARGSLPPGFERRLMDLDTGRRIPITEGTFTVQLTDERPTRHLRLIVGTEGFAEAESETIRPEETGLRAVYPNPSRGIVSVDYQLKAAQRVQIRIYDVLGRRVKTLVAERRPAGHHTVRWDSRSGSVPVASGTYIVRMNTESTSVSQRVSIVR